ncbi:MAG: hypothetical protein AB7E47_09040 [Desulfovibrionaceae bacterium]
MKKFLLVIGSQNSYYDSLRLFQEHGYACHVVPVPHELSYFAKNYVGFQLLGFTVHQNVDQACDAIAARVRRGEYDTGLIYSGAHYYGPDEIYSFGAHTLTELSLAAHAAATLRGLGIPVFYARACCGETFFTSPDSARRFETLTRPVSAFIVHTENLRRYMLHNCPALADRPFLISPLNAPLKRYMQTSVPEVFYDRYIYIGRWASLKNPRVALPVDEVTFKASPMFLACGGRLEAMERDRRLALARVSCYRAALGHFYDYFDNHADDPEEIMTSAAQRQNIQVADALYFLPKVFRLTNVAGKVLTYLLFGVPPIIPRDHANDFHRALLDRGMAIPVGPDRRIHEPSNKQNKAIRTSIMANADLFTFDPTYYALNGLVEYTAVAR